MSYSKKHGPNYSCWCSQLQRFINAQEGGEGSDGKNNLKITYLGREGIRLRVNEGTVCLSDNDNVLADSLIEYFENVCDDGYRAAKIVTDLLDSAVDSLEI